MELLSNEYHLVGPVVSPTKRSNCSLDCKSRTIDDASRRRKSVDDRRNGVCDCTRCSRRDPRQEPRSPREEYLRTSVVDHFEDSEPIPGPSRRFLATSWLTPARNAKKARVNDRGVQRADEKDNEITTEEDCTCDAEVITLDEYARIRPPDRVIVRNQRNGRRRNNVKRNKDEEDEEERMKKENEDTEEDSVYEELRTRDLRRTIARERELKRWIRRCRQECERRRDR